MPLPPVLSRGCPGHGPNCRGWAVSAPGFFAALAFLGTLAAGCEHKNRQCNSLNRVVNRGSARLVHSASATKEGDHLATKALADQFRAHIAELERLSLRDTRLSELSRSYRKMLGRFARLFDDLAVAMERKDVIQARKVEARMRAVLNSEEKIIEEINAYCVGGRSGDGGTFEDRGYHEN